MNTEQPTTFATRLALLMVSMVVFANGRAWAAEKEKADFSRWEKDIAAFERRDKDKPPPKNAVLFVGSSSIRLWDLSKSFADMATINRGFGGSRLADAAHFAPRIVLAYEPRVVVLYAGDNDIAAGKTPEQVCADFQDFVRTVHKKLPKTRIVFLSIKPSIQRWRLIEPMRKANALIEAECKKGELLRYLDVATPMLGRDGKPRSELFAKDGLHLNEKGYKLWAAALVPLLKEAAKIDRRIEELGSDQFVVREAAAKKLEAIGEDAVPALRRAGRSDDLELRLRATQILETIRFRGQRAVRSLGGEILDDEDGKGKRFVSVDLAGTKATDVDMAHLKWLDRIDSLNLSRTRATDVGLGSLGNLPHLQRLFLTGTAVTDAGLLHLKGLRGLEMLNLVGTKVDGDGLAHLESLDELRCVYLSDSPVTDEGLAHIQSLGWLRILALTRTQVTDAGLIHLQKLPLRSLGLGGTKLTDTGLVRLRGFGDLSYLSLADIPITDAGLAHLKGLRKLVVLDLSATRVTGKGLKHLKQSRLSYLYLCDTPVTTDGLASLRGLANLRRLDLAGTRLTVEEMTPLADLEDLRRLDLSRTTVTDACMASVKKLKRLEWLDLTGTKVTDAGLVHLREMHNLTLLRQSPTYGKGCLACKLPGNRLWATERFPGERNRIKSRRPELTSELVSFKPSPIGARLLATRPLTAEDRGHGSVYGRRDSPNSLSNRVAASTSFSPPPGWTRELTVS